MKTAPFFFDSKNAFPFFLQKVFFFVFAPMPSSVEILALHALLGSIPQKVEHARYSGADRAFSPKMEIL